MLCRKRYGHLNLENRTEYDQPKKIAIIKRYWLVHAHHGFFQKSVSFNVLGLKKRLPKITPKNLQKKQIIEKYSIIIKHSVKCLFFFNFLKYNFEKRRFFCNSIIIYSPLLLFMVTQEHEGYTC